LSAIAFSEIGIASSRRPDYQQHAAERRYASTPFGSRSIARAALLERGWRARHRQRRSQSVLRDSSSTSARALAEFIAASS